MSRAATDLRCCDLRSIQERCWRAQSGATLAWELRRGSHSTRQMAALPSTLHGEGRRDRRAGCPGGQEVVQASCRAHQSRLTTSELLRGLPP